MKRIFLFLLLLSFPLFAQRAPFASQSDLTADLSDSVLNNIYRHRLKPACCSCEGSVWVEGFGSYRERDSTFYRDEYHNGLGGILAGFNYGLSCDSYLNFFLGGSWGTIDIKNESNFETSSVLVGMAWESLGKHHFYGFAFVGGYLEEERRFDDILEEPRGVFLSSELTYARHWKCLCNPIFTGTLRYAGFFSRDYEHPESLGTFYIQDRSIQLLTLRGEIAAPLFNCLPCIEPYIGVAGRFQFDGNQVEGRILQDHERFRDGIDTSIFYGILGLRASKVYGCLNLRGNIETSYDSDSSWRILGELNVNYRY
jgi:hypothetical protein